MEQFIIFLLKTVNLLLLVKRKVFFLMFFSIMIQAPNPKVWYILEEPQKNYKKKVLVSVQFYDISKNFGKGTSLARKVTH